MHCTCSYITKLNRMYYTVASLVMYLLCFCHGANGEGIVTTASLGDPIITKTLEEPLVACNVTLNIPGCPLRSVSGNTLMVTIAVSMVTGNSTSIVSGVKKASAVQK